MKNIRERITELSYYLQSLAAPEFSSDVQAAVEREDKESLVDVCKRAKIPQTYLSTVVSVLLSVGPNQKWPPAF